MAYTKFHAAWAVTDEPTGQAWNHIETQWSAIKADADAHNHDTRYYTKTSADATFFALTTSVALGFDADKLDGSHFSDLVASVMPIGAIMIWSGTDGNVPLTWHICDGGAGTTDLRDKFVIGAGLTYAIDATGGAFSTAISGSLTIGSHAITGDEMPLHTHTYTDNYNNAPNYEYECREGTGAGPQTPLNGSERWSDYTGSGDGHGHAGSTISMNNITAIPPWYALYYIQKVT